MLLRPISQSWRCKNKIILASCINYSCWNISISWSLQSRISLIQMYKHVKVNMQRDDQKFVLIHWFFFSPNRGWHPITWRGVSLCLIDTDQSSFTFLAVRWDEVMLLCKSSAGSITGDSHPLMSSCALASQASPLVCKIKKCAPTGDARPQNRGDGGCLHTYSKHPAAVTEKYCKHMKNILCLWCMQILSVHSTSLITSFSFSAHKTKTKHLFLFVLIKQVTWIRCLLFNVLHAPDYVFTNAL